MVEDSVVLVLSSPKFAQPGNLGTLNADFCRPEIDFFFPKPSHTAKNTKTGLENHHCLLPNQSSDLLSVRSRHFDVYGHTFQ